MKQVYKTYQAYSRAWAYFNGVSVRCFDSTKQTTRPDAIYLLRVSSKRIRIIDPVNDKIRNCLEITGDPDFISPAYLKYLVIHKLPIIDYLKQGTCQQFINKSIVLLVLSDAYNSRGQTNKQVLYNELKPVTP